MAAEIFGPIPPAPAADTFVFDFTQQIGPTGTIVSAQWQCTVDAGSLVPDPVPMGRILSPPTFDAKMTSALVGNMIDGCLYVLQTQVTLDDQRVLIDSAGVQCRVEQLAVIEDDILTADEFRAMFPGFDNAVIYSDATIEFWINQAVTMPVIDAERWGQFYNLGICLWVAHILTINAVMAARGPMLGSGVPGSKSVGGVSISYDNQLGMEQNAGWYALTPYGNAFLRYLRMAGAGPIQVGTGVIFGGPGSLVFMPRPW